MKGIRRAVVAMAVLEGGWYLAFELVPLADALPWHAGRYEAWAYGRPQAPAS